MAPTEAAKSTVLGIKGEEEMTGSSISFSPQDVSPVPDIKTFSTSKAGDAKWDADVFVV